MNEYDLRQTRGSCMDTDKQHFDKTRHQATLPPSARCALNRCNLPAVILGSLTFQQHPSPLYIDGVTVLHRKLFGELDEMGDAETRAGHFIDYMTVQFRLHHLDEMGYESEQRIDRSRANYQRLLRGWAFNPDGKEGAVLKRWVESRFGLTPRFHESPLSSQHDAAYDHYRHDYSMGLYNTNALEAQLDLIYSYCQYELGRDDRHGTHLTLYRGSNYVERLELEGICGDRQLPLLLNNINSFSLHLERADEFGDQIIEVSVPKEKLFFYSELLPGCLRGEGEVIVLGGAYCAKILS